MQNLFADVIVAQRRRTLTALHIAPHHHAMRILAARIMAQQTPRLGQTCVVLARAIVRIRQIPKEA
jgi:hypothetical protein